MPKVVLPATFVASSALRSYLIPVTGNYLITGAGAQGGDGGAPGGKGAFVQGMFYLRQGDVLQIIVGRQGGPGRAATFRPEHPPCGGGGGGGTFVWKGTRDGTMPAWPLLVAGGGGGGGRDEGGDGQASLQTEAKARTGLASPNGHGGITNPCVHFGGGSGAGWLSAGAQGPGPIYCHGGTHWAGGPGIGYAEMAGGDGGFGGGGGGGFLGYAAGGGGGFGGGFGGGLVESHSHRVLRSGGGSSYNAGLNQINLSGQHFGQGCVTITAVPTPIVIHAPGSFASGRAGEMLRAKSA
jgi:hypothetical protein